MTVVVLVCAVLLAGAAILAVVRVERGPSMLDRTIALDVLTSVVIAALALKAGGSRRVDTVPVLLALALVGFLCSVTIARFAAVEPPGEGRVLTRAEVAALEAARSAAGGDPAGREAAGRGPAEADPGEGEPAGRDPERPVGRPRGGEPGRAGGRPGGDAEPGGGR